MHPSTFEPCATHVHTDTFLVGSAALAELHRTKGDSMTATERAQLEEPMVRFDYDNQAWTKDGRYVRCGHPEAMDCQCFGKLHEGEMAPSQEGA